MLAAEKNSGTFAAPFHSFDNAASKVRVGFIVSIVANTGGGDISKQIESKELQEN